MAKHPQAAFDDSPEYKIALKELREICDSNGLSMGKITLSPFHSEVYQALCEEEGVESTAQPQGRVLIVECAQLRELFNIDEEGLKREATGLDLRIERPTTKEEAATSRERQRRDTVSNSTRLATGTPMPQEKNAGKTVVDNDEVLDEDLDDDSDTQDAEGTSPVANLNATEAKDSISRMTSKEKLELIITHEQRTSVAQAAQRRLDEIGG